MDKKVSEKPDLQDMFIRLLASRHLRWILIVVGSLYLTKELSLSLWETLGETFWLYLTHPNRPQLAHQLFTLGTGFLYFTLFFIITATIVSLSHADDYLRRLTLKVIKSRGAYFIFVQTFLKSRLKSHSALNFPKELFEELDKLLEIGELKLDLHHKRSLTFLLGINYPVIKASLLSLQSHFDKFFQAGEGQATNRQAQQERTDRLQETKGILQVNLLDPLAELNHRTIPLAVFLADLASEPSYDKALDGFSQKLCEQIVGLRARNISKHQAKSDYVQILSEVNETFRIFKQRGKVRLGFPLFTFIDKKEGQRLESRCNDLLGLDPNLEPGKLQLALTQHLNDILGALLEFNRQKQASSEALASMLDTQRKIFNADRDIVFLYGFSQTVTTWLKQTIKEVSERRLTEFILITTEEAATTVCEEFRMRDELIENGFSNITLYSLHDLILIKPLREKTLNFVLGFEVINSTAKKAVFHFGAAQRLRILIDCLQKERKNVRLYLVGAKYKDIKFTVEDPGIENASIFDYTDVGQCVWINEDYTFLNAEQGSPEIQI